MLESEAGVVSHIDAKCIAHFHAVPLILPLFVADISSGYLPTNWEEVLVCPCKLSESSMDLC